MSKVALVHCPDYSLAHTESALERLFFHFGGIETFVKKDNRVLIKPNFIAADPPEEGSITNPVLLHALIRLVKRAGGIPSIGDSPAFGTTQRVAEVSGLREICEREKCALIDFAGKRDVVRDQESWQVFLAQLPQEKRARVKKLSFVTEAVNLFDCIINVPKLKVHVQMMLTGSVKNNYGFIGGKTKVLRHFNVHNNVELFSLFILALYFRIRPEFTVVDAIDVMEERGPRHGIPTRRKVIAGGADAIAIDAILSHLCGFAVSEVPILKYAAQYTLGKTNREKIETCGDSICPFVNFKRPEYTIPISFNPIRIVISMIKRMISRHRGNF